MRKDKDIDLSKIIIISPHKRKELCEIKDRLRTYGFELHLRREDSKYRINACLNPVTCIMALKRVRSDCKIVIRNPNSGAYKFRGYEVNRRLDFASSAEQELVYFSEIIDEAERKLSHLELTHVEEKGVSLKVYYDLFRREFFFYSAYEPHIEKDVGVTEGCVYDYIHGANHYIKLLFSDAIKGIHLTSLDAKTIATQARSIINVSFPELEKLREQFTASAKQFKAFVDEFGEPSSIPNYLEPIDPAELIVVDGDSTRPHYDLYNKSSALVSGMDWWFASH